MRSKLRRGALRARPAVALGEASAWFEASDLTLLTLERLTPERALGQVDGPRSPRAGERGRLHLQLEALQLHGIAALVRSVDEDSGCVELELLEVDAELGSALAQVACAAELGQGAPVHREQLESAAQRAAALRFLVENRATGWVHTPQGVCRLSAVHFDASSHEVSWERSGAQPRAPFLITIEGYNTLYRIPVPACRVEGAHLCSAAPPWIEASRSRRARRIAAAASVRVAFDHPLWPALRIERELLDLTQRGLSFSAASGREHVYPGLSIPRLFVQTGDGASIALDAQVVSAGGVQAPRFGCEVSPVSEADAARWLKLCEERLFPSTRRGAAEVWSVYRGSGYFGLSETLDGAFEHLKPAYVNASRALSSAPELGCQATWPALGSPRATVTNLRLTPNCWFSYHLAAQPDEALTARSAEVLRDLYRQYIEHCLATPGARWQMAYVQHNAHWSMRVHVDLPRRYTAQEQALVCEFRALQVRSVGLSAGRADQRPARRASPGERAHALRCLERKLPPIYFDALDYAPERFGLEDFKAHWARHGLERDRELLLAEQDGELLALGVVECAEPGLHLFGLLDTLRLYAIAERGEQAFGGLIDAARAWFRERGRRSFCYLEEQGQIAADGHHIKHMSPAFLTLLSVERLPEMLEQLYVDTVRS